jgi:metallo-beta-lactamase class B
VPEDPQFGTGPTDRFPAVTERVRVMQDGETVTIGETTITMHHTPGHTPGATTWTWPSCEGARCLDMVYVDSLTAVSNDGFRYSEVPGLVEAFRATLAKVRALRCDIVISTHPAATGLDDRVARRGALPPGSAADPLIDSAACIALADRSQRALDQRLAEEAKTR